MAIHVCRMKGDEVEMGLLSLYEVPAGLIGENFRGMIDAEAGLLIIASD